MTLMPVRVPDSAGPPRSRRPLCRWYYRVSCPESRGSHGSCSGRRSTRSTRSPGGSTRPMRPRRVVLTVTVLILAAGAGGAILWRVQRARERARLEPLRERLAEQTGDPEEHHWLCLRLADRGNDAEALGHLEIAAREAPRDLRVANDLRHWSVKFAARDRCIAFFEGLVASHPEMPEPRLQLALAYIDNMPDNAQGVIGQG